MTWNFFESGHGKGEHDGAGAVIKRALTHEQLKADGVPLKCARDIVMYLREHFTLGVHAVYSSTQVRDTRPVYSSTQVRDTRRVFWEVGIDEVKRDISWDCHPIPNLRQVHSVRGFWETNGHCIGVRQLSCFCYECIQGKWRRCVNTSWVHHWVYHSLLDIVEGEAVSDRDISNFTYQGSADILTDVLCVDDNYAVNAEEGNSEGSDFFFLKCTVPKKQATQNMVDVWGNFISTGTYFVEGLFYENLGDCLFKLLNDKPIAYMYSHLVRCVKIPMTPDCGMNNLYRISANVYELIYNSMPLELQFIKCVKSYRSNFVNFRCHM